MLARALFLLRDLGSVLGLVALCLFPFPALGWELTQAFAPGLLSALDPLLAAFLDFADASGQRAFPRALLRFVLAGLAVTTLFLPLRVPQSRKPFWRLGCLFLLLGFGSAVSAPHRFEALQVWELWALLLLVGLGLSSCWTAWHSLALLTSLYLVTGGVILHAFWVALPVTAGRLGGLFHHANALSTFCCMGVAVFLWRSTRQGSDRHLARILVGVLLGLVTLSGSLTGLLVVGGLGGFFLTRGRGPRFQAAGVSVPVLGLLLANFWGGWAAVTVPAALLCSLWIVALFTKRVDLPWAAVVASGFALVMAASLVLAPLAEPRALAATSRARSVGARWLFYRAAAGMASEHPFLGCGQDGFSRLFPRYQGDINEFSKYPHCLPLQIGAEWGPPALMVLLAIGWLLFRRTRLSPPGSAEAAGAWVVLVLVLHSLTGVQDQFPYLLALGSLGLAVALSGRPETEPPAESFPGMLARLLVALTVVGALAVNAGRAAGEFDLGLARRLALRGGPTVDLAVQKLLLSAHARQPLDSEVARQWGNYLLTRGEGEASQGMAELAVWLDPQRASCRHLLLAGRPRVRRAPGEMERALECDPINFPDFHRWKAEALLLKGDSEAALHWLRFSCPDYSPGALARLPDFRARDLAEQLPKLIVLRAALLEQQGQSEAAAQSLHDLKPLLRGGSPLDVEALATYLWDADLESCPLTWQMLESVGGVEFPSLIGPQQ